MKYLMLIPLLVALMMMVTACSTPVPEAATQVPEAPPTPEIDATVAEPTQPPSIGAWSINESTDILDDSKTIIASLTATQGTSTFGEPIVLVLRCKGKELDAFILWESYLDNPRVTMRADGGTATTSAWNISNTNTTTFYPNPRSIIIQKLIPSARLVVRVTPYNENPITAVFDLTGIDKAGQKILEACEG